MEAWLIQFNNDFKKYFYKKRTPHVRCSFFMPYNKKDHTSGLRFIQTVLSFYCLWVLVYPPQKEGSAIIAIKNAVKPTISVSLEEVDPVALSAASAPTERTPNNPNVITALIKFLILGIR